MHRPARLARWAAPFSILVWAMQAAAIVPPTVAAVAAGTAGQPAAAAPEPTAKAVPAVAAPPNTAAALAADTSPSAAAPVRVEASVSDPQPTFGARIEVRVTLRYPSGYRVFFPTKPDLRPLLSDTRDPGRTQREEKGGMVTETVVIPVLAVRSGLLKTPAIEVPWRAAGDNGESGTVTLAPLRVQVRSQFAADTEVTPSPLPQPRALVEDNVPLQIAMLVAAMMALSAVLTAAGLKFYRDRAARRAPAPRVPPHLTALNRLDALQQSGRLVDAEASAAFAELSEILRQYLGGRFRVAALDMTSTELLQHFHKVELRGITHEELRQFAELSDLVKFARLPATTDELQAEAAFVRRVVERTMLTAAEQETLRRAEIERLARLKRLRLQVMAPLPLRVQALAIDVLAGALATALLAWVAIDTGKSLLFDIAYLLLPVWLVVRDVLASQSPGKTLVGLQIAAHDETPPPAADEPLWLPDETDDEGQVRQAGPMARLLRNLLLALPLAGWIAEAVTCLRLPEQRRMGDQWAATRVVDARHGQRRGVPGWVPALLLLALAVLTLLLPLAMGGRP